MNESYQNQLSHTIFKRREFALAENQKRLEMLTGLTAKATRIAFGVIANVILALILLLVWIQISAIWLGIIVVLVVFCVGLCSFSVFMSWRDLRHAPKTETKPE